MNVYDFDGTIYRKDSTVSFGVWCCNRHPYLWLTFFPKALRIYYLFQRGKMTRARMTLEFLKILRLRDFEQLIEGYWDRNEKHISAWYLARQKPDDLIITAAPSCIIEPIARRIGFQYVATEYDREYGVFLNNLMYAKNKAWYMIEHGLPVIENFYSDSLSDTPLALCAEKAYMVKGRAKKVTDWPHLDPDTLKKIHKKVDIGWEFRL